MFSDTAIQHLRCRARYLTKRLGLYSVEPDDLVHDVIVSILVQGEKVHSPLPYALAALRLRAFYAATRQRRTFVPLDPDLPGPSADPDRAVLVHQLLSHPRLSSRSRRLLELSALGYTAEQMALSLGIAVSSVSGLLARARQLCFLRVTRASRRSGSSLHLRSSAL